MHTFQLISNLGEEKFYYPSPKPLESDAYLIWYVSEMLSVELESRLPIERYNTYGTFGATEVTEERIRWKVATEHRQLINQHIFSVEPYSKSLDQLSGRAALP